jgi:hypothetical protein
VVWRLGRRTEIGLCESKDPRDVRLCECLVVGNVVNPRRLCSSRRDGCSVNQAHIRLVYSAIRAQPGGSV